MEPMISFEVDKIVKSIKTIQIKEIGTTIKFATKYQNMSRLNQQLINNMLQAGTGEYSDYSAFNNFGPTISIWSFLRFLG